ncbi:MAG: HesA/MoeB/ThiF family protein [Bacteroidales bacterium]|nr:HesA/MoeB/ThiF family protein [Bacteroidales bacterium]
MLNKEELNRYNRHIVLPGFGEDRQEKLKKTSVLVVGAGGLASPLLIYLTSMGIGKIGIIDDDKVSITNLQRQILYNSNQLNESKVEKARERLLAINPNVNIDIFHTRITLQNAFELATNYNIICDCSDNFETRYVSNEISKKLKIPFVFASVRHYEGHVSVFNYKKGISYTDLFPEPPVINEHDESEKGILGIVPGVIGTLQACEVVKIATGIGEVLDGKLLTYNTLNHKQHIISL